MRIVGLPSPVSLIKSWRAAITDPQSYTQELLSVARLLCSVGCPREALELFHNFHDDSAEGQSTRKFVNSQARLATGRYSADAYLFESNPGPFSDYVSGHIQVQVCLTDKSTAELRNIEPLGSIICGRKKPEIAK
jgi:hypothetical protein